MDVGIRDLKAHLSGYVDRATRGEVIRVTHRGVPRAVLMALPTTDHLERGLSEGWVIRRSTKPPGPFQPVEPALGSPSTEEILGADRGD